MAGRPWQVARDGLVIRVRVTPKSSRDDIEGIEETAQGPALKARVRAIPDKGQANAAVERLIADWLSVPKRDVVLDAGGKSRVKSLRVSGDAAALAARAEALMAAMPGPKTEGR